MTNRVQIGNVQVNVDELLRLAHACDPLKCRHAKNCCSSYEVTIDRSEANRIVGCTPDASRLAGGLLDNGGLIDPIDETEGGLCLNTDEQGECVFAYRASQGATYCSLHTLALEWGLPPASVKPKACALWPLAIHAGEHIELSVQDDAYEFPCNTLRKTGARKLHAGVASIVEAVFGPEFLMDLVGHLERSETANSATPT